MRNEVISNAIGTLDQLIFKARDALWDIEREMFGTPARSDGMYEYPNLALRAFLQELHDVLVVVLEAAEMSETRTSLVKAWSAFKKQGLEHTDDNYHFQTCESPALTFVGHLLLGLRTSVSEQISSSDAWTLTRLEAMLRDTAALIHRRGVVPKNESDVQKVMHDYLSAAFADFRSNPQIGGALKNFKPDCGIEGVGAAIEFKFVRAKQEVAIAASGIIEDTAGYRGSKDWVRFYSVIYQAAPFMLESHLKSDLRRIGAATWVPIVVNGTAEPRIAKKRVVSRSGRSSKKKPSPDRVEG
ncbi:hypothetical protein PMN64_24580 [Bradyrhizobium sp. UFLA01-814]|uniref:PD-(D/E)XK nuclease domain-containing protein n=1 Tax=Bradyrhizobium sp. UFLA01-814 TaxID=3023480 RepID=UPI00398A781F